MKFFNTLPLLSALSSLSLAEIPDQLTYGAMMTDAGQDLNLVSRRSDDIDRLKQTYNTILLTIDLPVGSGERQWVDCGRKDNRLTELAVSNIRWWQDHGFKVHIIVLNEPSVRNGKSAKMCSWQRSGISASNMYTAAQLEKEKVLLREIVDRLNPDGIMPVLEASHKSSIDFVKKETEYLRNTLNYKGKIIVNFIGDADDANQELVKSHGVISAQSISNSEKDWANGRSLIRNSDGDQKISCQTPDLIRSMVTRPGNKGFYIWGNDLVGYGGRQPMEDICEAYTPDLERIPANVPAAPENKFDCSQGGSKTNLIKPESDNDKKLVLVLSCEYLKKIKSLKVGSESGRNSTNYTTLANGKREHFRFSKPGAAYGNTCLNGTFINGSTFSYCGSFAKRVEGFKMTINGTIPPTQGGGASSPTPVTPQPTPAPSPTPAPTPTNPEHAKIIHSIYMAILERQADASGLKSNSEALANGQSVAQVRQRIAFSTECAQKIEQIYLTYLKRKSDAGGMKHFQTSLAEGRTMAEVRQIIANSPEAQKKK